MKTLIITRGLPGSGKTTAALGWIEQARKGGESITRVNRDDIRMEIFAKPVLNREQEEVITEIQKARVRAALRGGVSVVIDDTNLRMSVVKQWQRIARSEGAKFEVHNFDLPVEQCVENLQKRAAAGGRPVPESAVQRMAKRYLRGGFPKVTPLASFEPYVPDHTLPQAWILDVDGTLTTGPHERGPFEWHKVGQDKPREAVVALAQALSDVGYTLLVFSGRSDACFAETASWLHQHEVPFGFLSMRRDGDFRPDDEVKAEIFASFRNRFWIRGVVDDRMQVVDFWRSIGLTCLQVDEGDF